MKRKLEVWSTLQMKNGKSVPLAPSLYHSALGTADRDLQETNLTWAVVSDPGVSNPDELVMGSPTPTSGALSELVW